MTSDRLAALLRSRPVRLLVWVALAAYIFTVFRGLAVKEKQWDLKTYYYAAVVHASGGDPYDKESLSQAAGQEMELPYVYPPVTLYLFRLLLVSDYRTCYVVFLVLKLAALALLVWLWTRFLDPQRGYGLLLVLFCVLAFRKALIRDLNAGNISSFEQILIWVGALCYLRGRTLPFSLLVAGSALFKFTSIALLGLTLVERGGRRMAHAITAGLCFLSVNVISYVTCPALYKGFMANALSLDERGKVNPSSLALARDFGSWVAGHLPSGMPHLDHILYACLLTGLALAVYKVLRRIEPAAKRRELLVFCFFVYALAAPRFKDYSYMLLIVPALFVVRHAITSFLGKALACLLTCFYVFTYQPLLAAAVLLCLLLKHLAAASPAGESRQTAGARVTR